MTHSSDLNGNLKKGNLKLNEIKKSNKTKLHPPVEGESKITCQKVKKMQCLSERKYFIDQVSWEMEQNDFKSESIDETKSIIEIFETRLENFCKINSELDGYIGTEDADIDIQRENDDLIKSLHDKIYLGRIRLSEIKKKNDDILQENLRKAAFEKECAESKRKEKELSDEKLKIDNLLIRANYRYSEIETRFNLIDGKCRIDVDKLSDHEILNYKKT